MEKEEGNNYATPSHPLNQNNIYYVLYTIYRVRWKRKGETITPPPLPLAVRDRGGYGWDGGGEGKEERGGEDGDLNMRI